MSAAELLAPITARMRLPLVAAPMFTVSGVDLVVAACRSGVVGAFPTANCRTSDELDAWLSAMRERLADSDSAPAPVAPNLIVHASNTRLADDLEVVLRHRPELVITSVGSSCCRYCRLSRWIVASSTTTTVIATGVATPWAASVCATTRSRSASPASAAQGTSIAIVMRLLAGCPLTTTAHRHESPSR